MAPEYALEGVISNKSDVYSFGILMLEIISGKKNRGFYNPDNDPSLLLHVGISSYLSLFFYNFSTRSFLFL